MPGRGRRALALLASAWLAACGPERPVDAPRTPAPVAAPTAPPPAAPTVAAPMGAERVVRVVVATGEPQARLGGNDGVELRALGLATPLVLRGAELTVTSRGGRLRVGGAARGWEGAPGEALEVWSAGGAPLRLGTRRYRGWLRLVPTDSGLLAVNHLPLEQYLRGVVPLEIGPRRADEQAAVEAQAVAARSYTVVRLGRAADRPWDLRGTTADQVYGGVDAERPESDAAIAATAGLVLTYAGRVVDAPYSAACGGATAAGHEAFRGAPTPYLPGVDDHRPDGSAWCEIAPGFRWERTLEGDALHRGLERHLRSYLRGVERLAAVTEVRTTGATPAGRARGVEVRTRDGARHVVERNDLRGVLRAADGAMLPSTYLSLAATRGRDGTVTRLVLTGRGNGHGVGMCQWGAIARARAGQDVRTILATYYPGTDLRRAD
jgi:stage II sporulation protein D